MTAHNVLLTGEEQPWVRNVTSGPEFKTTLPTREVSVGDRVRVHYHSPDLFESYAEGMVSRVDVITRLGRVFIVDVARDVILDREQAIKSGCQNYVLYERPDDFPGRIEILSEAKPALENASEHETEIEPEHVAVERRDTRRRKNIIAVLFGRARRSRCGSRWASLYGDLRPHASEPVRPAECCRAGHQSS